MDYTVNMAPVSGQETTVLVEDAILTRVSYSTLGDFYDYGSPIDTKGSKIRTASGWLQRELQKDQWKKDDSLRCKTFLASLILGSGNLDAIILLPIRLVLTGLEVKLENSKLPSEIEAISQAIVRVEEDIKTGGKWYCIDGQNRIFQSIVPFIDNKFTLPKKNWVINVKIGNKKPASIAGKYFKELDKKVQDYILNIKLITVVAQGGDIDSFTNALIWKNEGLPWTQWQKELTKYFFTEYRSQLSSVTQSRGPILDLLNKIKGEKYHRDGNGHEFLVSELLFWMMNKTWPSYSDHVKLLKTSTKDNDLFVQLLKRYLKEFGLAMTKGTVSHMDIKNYVILRYALDNPHRFNRLDIPSVKVKKPYEFVGRVKHWNKLMKSADAKYPNKPRWPQPYVETNGLLTKSKNPDGFLYACSETGDDFIYNRISLMCDRIREDMTSMLDKNVLQTVDKTPMPSLAQVIDYNDGLDYHGDEIDYLELDNERGHIIARDNEGSNKIDNLKVEKRSDNASWGAIDH